MNVLIVEDSEAHAEAIEETVHRFEAMNASICDSEASFQEIFPRLKEKNIDLIILDVQLQMVAPGASPFLQPQQPGFRDAGLRCLRMLKSDASVASIPVIVYSVRPPSEWPPADRDLPEHYVFLLKDPTHEQLFLRIQSEFPRLRLARKSRLKKAVDAVESVSLGWLSVNLKKLFSRKD